MPTEMFATSEFDRFAKKARLPDAVLVDAIVRAEQGLVDADLGGGVVKLRLARPGQGKSGGYRTIVAFVFEARAFYLFGYAKSDLGNIGEATLSLLRRRASALQAASEEAIEALITQRELRRIER